ncbi:bifunctional non-homologous end joining protein LigD [Paenibacillus sp. 1_12]|uniref:non-homologous end-joining DNA ligase n=1 Tax=Paenibacillus sp. 1_12 TaxID=1566278 RepID=UPI0008EC45E5|nr:non-homologous end-joining DNA ligase [Paenibacillus sp. 1_12]SFK71059.1 bifunctional non-homologous end joining protein LigD [Paenibacillus sp. 1_12]
MGTSIKGTVQIEGHEITVTNPEKVLWPNAGITKLEYLQKLIILAPYLLHYCQNRYLTTIRFPNGVDDKSFYQKAVPKPTPSFVKTATFQGINYVNLDSLPTLIWLGNLACLEFHPSFHYINDELPAEWIVDLDPSQEVEPRIMQAALLVGEALETMGIESIPKTSGATGIQLIIPIQHGRYTFEQLRLVGRFLGSYLTKKYPDLFTIERLKKNRGDLIYIDYLQHWHGKTMSAPYTPRARSMATVSTPLKWEELRNNCRIEDFTLLTIEKRLGQYGDLIQRMEPQSLEPVLAILD